MNKPINQPQIQTIIGFLQLVTLLIGVASVFSTLGKRDQVITHTSENLSEMSGIVQELVKAQVQGATKDNEHDRVLDDLRFRIYNLEQP
jgi:hypothetical protein